MPEMDFIDWCGFVMNKLIEAGREPHLDEIRLAQIVYGEEFRMNPGFWESTHRKAMLDAMNEMVSLGLIEEDGRFWTVTVDGRAFARDPLPLWQEICATELEPDEERILRVVNQFSPKVGLDPDHAWLEEMDREPLLVEYGISAGLDMHDVLYPVSQDLEGRSFVQMDAGAGSNLDLQSTYRGLVWEFRRGFTTDAQFIDALVREWETTSVDFKRELHLDTADQKAEFVKDVLGLTNTQASGRRWLIIGFDDKTRAYHSPPDPKLSQDRMEQILASLSAPIVDIRYEVVDYRGGQVGKLEMLRDPKKLPYAAAREVIGAGNRKRLTAGQIFVRHGSQTEEPTQAELLALQEEAERARSM
jgi:hypothetical protein